MLINASIVVIVVATIYSVYYTYKRHERLTCMAGMMIAMTIGMLSSISLGTMLGFLFNHDLQISSMIAIIVGMAAGYLAGRPISLMAAIDGMGAGIMGGMMGAMLGVMLIPDTSQNMILFVDIIFVIMMYMLLKLIDEEAGAVNKEEKTEPKSKAFISNPVMIISVVFLAGILILGKMVFFKDVDTSNITTKLGLEKVKPGDQVATITVSPNGYGPQNIELKAGVPTKIDFKTEAGAGCLRQVVSKDLGINAILKENQDNYVALKDLKAGTYSYTCGMGMFGGKITVK